MALADIHLKVMGEEDIFEVCKFTDQWIGSGYFSEEELRGLLALSNQTSFLALSSEDTIVGIRLSIAPGNLDKLHLKALSPNEWSIPLEKASYFKSLFVADSHQGMGIGKKLSERSMSALKDLGALGVICHSWLESPGDSSRRYLKKLGFDEVKSYENFWIDVDYECTRCQKDRCRCTAVEMIKVFE